MGGAAWWVQVGDVPLGFEERWEASRDFWSPVIFLLC